MPGFFEIFAGALAGFYAVIPSYGLAIIFLTLVVRLILLPLGIKQTKSMREMQAIQPEIKRLQQKHKGDRTKLNEEMMKLYKEHGVNPFGGCLPLVMQIPVFIGLYQVVRYNLKYMGYRLTGASNFVVVAGAAGVVAALQNSALAKALLNSPLQTNQFLPGLRLDCTLTEAFRGAGSFTLPGEACGVVLRRIRALSASRSP